VLIVVNVPEPEQETDLENSRLGYKKGKPE
jgi:hypothetical protein